MKKTMLSQLLKGNKTSFDSSFRLSNSTVETLALWVKLAAYHLKHVTARIKQIQMRRNAAIQDCTAKMLRQTTAAPAWNLGLGGV